MLNNINIAGLSEYANEVKQDDSQSKATYGVTLNWESGTKTQISTKNMVLGEHKLIRCYRYRS